MLAVDCGTNVQFDGAESLSVFASSDWAERGFCSKCGSHLFYRWKKANQYFIPAGLLDGDRKWIFDHQVFIDEKPSFYAFANETKNLTAAEVFALYTQPASETR